MRYLIILICGSLFLTGCFTVQTVEKARFDRKPERVDSLLTSYKDTSGNTVVIYTKRNDKFVYKAVMPLDSIISSCQAVNEKPFINQDSTVNNFKGVYLSPHASRKKDSLRIVLFLNETPLSDTMGLYKEMENNAYLVTNYTGKLKIPVDGEVIYTNGFIKARTVNFAIRTGNKNDSNYIKDGVYVIAFSPGRRKYWRYLLVPFTVCLDAATWPVQLVIGIIALRKVPIS